MRNSCLSALGIVLVLLGWARSAAVAGAQETALSGTVLDESGATLPGATVSALSVASGKVTTAVADDAGHFELEGLPAGPYRITARLQGFSGAGHSVSLSPGEAVLQDFTLDVGTLSEEITVTAARGERATSEIPQIVTIVGSNQIEDRRPAGVQEAMERTPSMRTIETNPYRARPQLRGLDGSRVALMVDGERLNNARFDVGVTGVTPAIIDVAHLDSIEVVAGAGSSLYGSDAMAGTVNLITEPPRRPESGVSLDAHGDVDYQTNGDFKKGTLGANLASRKLAFRGTASKFDLDDYHISGRQGIDREDVLRLGRFAVELGNDSDGPAAPPTDVAGSYGVFELPRGSDVPNGGAEGWSALADAWYHPTEKQNVRLKYMRSRQDDLGAPFTGPPYSPLLQTAFFSDFDKVSARYEALEITKWLARASVGAYRQKLSRPQNDFRSGIEPGSSFVGTPGARVLTGRDSAYVFGINNETENNITSWGLDAQLNMQPLRGVLYTTGVGYLQDESVDHFSRETPGANGGVTGLKTTPDTTYRNIGWFNQFEVSRVSWLRLSGGFRIDNWKSEAVPSPGYPPPSELYVHKESLPQIVANPGALNVAGIQGLGELLDGDGSLTSNNTVATGNLGALLLLSSGVHPYVRFGTSYREPEVTVRYGIRNFGTQTRSGQAIPNREAKPERGRSLDLGLKLDRRSVRACVGYYRNDLSGFSSTVASPTYGIPANPPLGVLATPGTSPVVHQVQFFQRITGDSEVHFRGWEGAGEASISLGGKGSLAPFVSLSWMKSIDDAPSAKDERIVQKYYNRSDTPIRLEGSVDEIPARAHPSSMGTVALRYLSPAAKWWIEYEWRFAGQITNTDPESVLASVTPFPVQYGGLKSLEGYDKHSIRAGLRLGKDGPLKFTVGIDNLYDSLFFLPYQNAPTPGRSLIVGMTFDAKNVLGI